MFGARGLTSSVFAILNLRALYFALSGLLAHFRYLKHSLVVVLFLWASRCCWSATCTSASTCR